MSNSEGYKEVYFHEYCKSCQHEEDSSESNPCDECLGEPANLYSHKPVKYEPKETRK